MTNWKSYLGFLFLFIGIYSVYLIAGRGPNKANVGGNCQDFLKWRDQTNKKTTKKKTEKKFYQMKTSQILCWQYLRHLKHNELLLLKSKFVITLLKTSSVELSNTVLWLLINWATSRSNFRIWELMQLKNISRKYIFNVSQQTTTVIDSIFEELCCQYK